MLSIKSLLAGFFYIVILGLVIQLAYMFIAMGYTELVRAYPWIAWFGGYIGYAVGLAVYILLMGSGGMLTAALAKNHPLPHCLVVGASTTLLSVLSSQNNDELTWFSIVFVILGITFTVAGGMYWKNGYQGTAGTLAPR